MHFSTVNTVFRILLGSRSIWKGYDFPSRESGGPQPQRIGSNGIQVLRIIKKGIRSSRDLLYGSSCGFRSSCMESEEYLRVRRKSYRSNRKRKVRPGGRLHSELYGLPKTGKYQTSCLSQKSSPQGRSFSILRPSPQYMPRITPPAP
ncbi:hypothetical protein M970_050390 [Encephalitozoon cuniculi EcunIII-L]|nr:hypothetical protein M970_050390 [Encephalitozoon cuniculi EcunIII-L]UYI27833.1 hypothetical protein J0A71_08g17200 [Encephalitozoon cuniculi]